MKILRHATHPAFQSYTISIVVESEDDENDLQSLVAAMGIGISTQSTSLAVRQNLQVIARSIKLQIRADNESPTAEGFEPHAN